MKINIWNSVFRVIIPCSLQVVIASIFNVEFHKIKLVSQLYSTEAVGLYVLL
jgi:hypothetical protein